MSEGHQCRVGSLTAISIYMKLLVIRVIKHNLFNQSLKSNLITIL